MANSRIAKFITEAAPSQYVTVIRHRASKMLDTIKEEDRDNTVIDSLSSKSPSFAAAAAAVTKNTTATSSSAAASTSDHFLTGFHRSLLHL
ncbi:hypothetical protein LINPERPRIM_LOCUS7041 [Linum perenne]